MQQALMIQAVVAFLLAYQVGSCQTAEASSSTSWSTTVTTRTSSTSRIRRITASPALHNTSRSSAADSAIRKIGNGRNDRNCVLYLRQQRGIKLPAQNLTTYAAKVSIINAPVPQEKSVAIIKTPGRNAGIGHLAEVTGLEQNNGKVTMRLSEANNPNPGYYERTITGKNLEEIQKSANIVGYYVEPRETVKVQGAAAPRYL